MCHLDVRLDNILVFRSDFSLVKLCDFGSVRTQGDIVIKKNELLPYCPAELVAKHANEYYQVDRCQDVFQFGVVVFFCLFGRLPWQVYLTFKLLRCSRFFHLVDNIISFDCR